MTKIQMFSIPSIRGNMPSQQKIESFLNPYERFQMERYGNILKPSSATPDNELFESGIEEIERLAAWTEAQAEQQLNKQEDYKE